jgi:hypothetical protein
MSKALESQYSQKSKIYEVKNNKLVSIKHENRRQIQTSMPGYRNIRMMSP